MRNIFYLTILFLGSLRGLAQPTAPPTEPPVAERSLEFVANKGQWAPAVRYAAAVPGGHLCLEPGGLRYVLLQPIEHPHGPAREGSQPTPTLPAATDVVQGHQLRVHFVGADASTPLTPTDATGEVRNYLQGNDPAHWASAVPSYRQVRYEAPWPGIAARFYENATQHLEYDFEIAPRADADLVQLRYEGTTSLWLSDDGQLHVGTSVGDLTELAPHAYQVEAATGARQAVACRYRLSGGTVSFELGHYDHRRALVIDPTVLFSTYSGARGSNWGFTATYDAAGNLYSGGIVLNDMVARAVSYPTTVGAFQTTFGGVIDIALIKYNTTANGPASRVWATYLGGNQADFPSSLEVNARNELLILGSTASTNYPTTAGAYQTTFKGGSLVQPFGSSGGVYAVPAGTDIIVTRLTADGGGLAASTYLGGSGNDGVVAFNPTLATRQLPQNYGDALRSDIISDSQGNVYIASCTASPNFPTTAGSFGPANRGGTCDAVVCKLPPALNALTWSGYLGGQGADAAYSIQLDAASNVYVAGGTLSPDFPATAGSLQTTAQGNVDGFVARIAANGSRIERATYLGTDNYDQAFFVQLGADGGVYLLGQTLGNWPVSPGVYSNPGSRQFIEKLSPDLNQVQLSTVFGSGRNTLDISPTAFLVDQCDRVYACGWGGQINQYVYAYAGYVNNNGYTDGMATTPNAVRGIPDTPGLGSDFYLAQFSAGLKSLDYGTYYGDPTPYSEGDHVDGGTSRFDPRGVVYAAVCSCFNRNGFPVPPGANSYSPTNGALAALGYSTPCNNAAFKLNFEPTVADVGPGQAVCSNSPALALSGQPTGGIWSGPGVSGSVAAGFVFTPSAALVGTQTLTYTIPGVTTACTARASLTVLVNATPQTTVAALPNICPANRPLALSGQPAGGTWSGPGVSGSVAAGFVFTPTVALIGTQTLTYTPPLGQYCTVPGAPATVTIRVLPGNVAIVLPADTVLCPGSAQRFRLRATPAGGTWRGPGVSGSVAAGFSFAPPAAPGTVALTYTADEGTACEAVATRRVTLLAAPLLAPRLLPMSCQVAGVVPVNIVPYTVQFRQDSASLLAQSVVTWDFGDGSEFATGTTVRHTYRASGSFQPKVEVRFNQSRCSATTPLPLVVVQPTFVPNIITPNGDAQNEFFVPHIGGCPPRLQVFSRWGNVVYDDPAYQNNWAATGLVAGLYYYLLTPPDGAATIKGWVEVVK